MKDKFMPIFFSIVLILSIITPISDVTKVNAEAQSVTIKTDALNVRSGPGLSYSIISQVNRNENFKVTAVENDWIQIELDVFTKGWVAEWLVTSDEPTIETEDSSKNKEGQTTVSSLRIRSGPGTANSIIAVLGKGDHVSILDRKGEWLEISSDKGSGWVHKDYIQTRKKQMKKVDSTPIEKVGTISTSALNVRSEPSLNSSVIGTLQKGDTVTVSASVPGWYQIQFGNNEAWINNQYIQINQNGETGENVDSSSSLTGKVTVESVNIRSQGSLNGKVIAKASKGDRFQLLKKENNWYQVELADGQMGWIAGWLIEKNVDSTVKEDGQSKESTIKILYNGTNIRSDANVNASIVKRANSGDVFSIVSSISDWYEIDLGNGQTGFIAGWVVSLNNNQSSSDSPSPTNRDGTIEGKTIVLDPGHGGIDSGTTGFRGTLEKQLTLKTAENLYYKLKHAGANVILTRNDDRYLHLNSRVEISHSNSADAFISLHYDSINDSSINGFTTYYYHDYQKELAVAMDQKLGDTLTLRNRGIKKGDFFVIRENSQPSVLIELGYLSNPNEERTVTSSQYQDMAAISLYNGITSYFEE
ncbi:N-acetylmuramoyl-L-alanine amidase [Bacillus pakistanensis]|uniref:N-acetylmuramoyl-L-alanine amidase n=1 Tax=Rossellomorea pakistanensis TaxID=992288 RepID=A0ABS2NAC4_9BACI|nr:SH3 domain-containing protein [Bacillus pakistanensis]MBM7584802.1 N-acetylmuramoyl-L-alanine amidase [Bacillus pakistanensis]